MLTSMLPEKPIKTFADPFQHLPENETWNAQIF
jgi:hypothetical protein